MVIDGRGDGMRAGNSNMQTEASARVRESYRLFGAQHSGTLETPVKPCYCSTRILVDVDSYIRIGTENARSSLNETWINKFEDNR